MNLRSNVGKMSAKMQRFLIPAAIILAIAAPAWVAARVDQRLIQINCQSIHNQQHQLEALQQVADELGLPGDFQIEPLPEECR